MIRIYRNGANRTIFDDEPMTPEQSEEETYSRSCNAIRTSRALGRADVPGQHTDDKAKDGTGLREMSGDRVKR